MTTKTITSFKYLSPILEKALDFWRKNEDREAWDVLEQQVLFHRVKFPILEKVAIQLKAHLEEVQLEELYSRLAKAKHESCYPVIGKLLQLELCQDLKPTYRKAIKHIIEGDKWYVCDIISERVFGEGTLQYFDQSLPLLKLMADYDNIWIQRSIGIGTHYATKKGATKAQAEQLLFLMLENGYKTQLYIKKGIGWPAKTIGKFHPDLVHKHADLIRATKLSTWFKNKINIGLSMAKAEPIDL
jgi:3-methyladenine DNA glycosylase AlkD